MMVASHSLMAPSKPMRNEASMGEVALDTASRHSGFFGEEIASTLAKQRQIDGAENEIALAELLPVIVLRHLWSSKKRISNGDRRDEDPGVPCGEGHSVGLRL